MTEEWKLIPGYDNNYCISNIGRIKSLSRVFVGSNGVAQRLKGKILTPSVRSNNGYYVVRLSFSNIDSLCFVHRLVAAAFIPNPENKPCVNHINGIKTDNSIENLEWVTIRENNIHSYANGLNKRKRPVVDNTTGIRYNSIKEASLHYGINHNTLRNMLANRQINNTALSFLNHKITTI